jgi:hypothetical protein
MIVHPQLERLDQGRADRTVQVAELAELAVRRADTKMREVPLCDRQSGNVDLHRSPQKVTGSIREPVDSEAVVIHS